MQCKSSNKISGRNINCRQRKKVIDQSCSLHHISVLPIALIGRDPVSNDPIHTNYTWSNFHIDCSPPKWEELLSSYMFTFLNLLGLVLLFKKECLCSFKTFSMLVHYVHKSEFLFFKRDSPHLNALSFFAI